MKLLQQFRLCPNMVKIRKISVKAAFHPVACAFEMYAKF